MALLEICCYSVECAVTAQRQGADRIELCAAPKEGGLTPSFGVLKSARQAITIPVHPIIRPRGGGLTKIAAARANSRVHRNGEGLPGGFQPAQGRG